MGVGAIAARLCQLYPGLTCVGIDVLPEVLRLAAAELTGLGLAARVELRLQSVSEMSDEAVFDLAWLAQPFIPRTAFEAGIPHVHRALQPNRWVVVPLATGAASDPFEMAVFAHTAHMLGGGPIHVDEAEALLTGAGFDQITPTSWRGQMLVLSPPPLTERGPARMELRCGAQPSARDRGAAARHSCARRSRRLLDAIPSAGTPGGFQARTAARYGR